MQCIALRTSDPYRFHTYGRSIERMRSDEFIDSLLPAHAALAALVHTSGTLSALVRLHQSVAAAAAAAEAPRFAVQHRGAAAVPGAAASTAQQHQAALKMLEAAVASLASGLARAATAAAGSLDVPSSLGGLLEDVAVLEGGLGREGRPDGSGGGFGREGLDGSGGGLGREGPDGWRQGRRLLDTEVMAFVLTRFQKVGRMREGEAPRASLCLRGHASPASLFPNTTQTSPHLAPLSPVGGLGRGGGIRGRKILRLNLHVVRILGRAAAPSAAPAAPRPPLWPGGAAAPGGVHGGAGGGGAELQGDREGGADSGAVLMAFVVLRG